MRAHSYFQNAKVKKKFMLLFVGFFCIVVLYISFKINNVEETLSLSDLHSYIKYRPINLTGIVGTVKIPSEAEFRQKALANKIKALTARSDSYITVKLKNLIPLKQPTYNVFLFYYTYFKSKSYDDNWNSWNTMFSNEWDNQLKTKLRNFNNLPDDISSNYYPLLGPYSSRNITVIDIHMKNIRKTGIGVLIVSWIPPELKSESTDDVFQLLLEKASEYQLKISPHIESYEGRHQGSVRRDIEYLFSHYGFHEAFYKIRRNGMDYPVYFIYESFTAKSTSWAELFHKRGKLTVRGSILDGIFMGHYKDSSHRYHIKKSNFDGFYSYFAINGYTYGSTWKNWPVLKKFADANSILFLPCVGPGYVDVYNRPWNGVNTRHRQHGNYYEMGWKSALIVKPDMIGVTSYNNWLEGTQIEPAVSKTLSYRRYLDYEPEGPYFYLNLTQWWVSTFSDQILLKEIAGKKL